MTLEGTFLLLVGVLIKQNLQSFAHSKLAFVIRICHPGSDSSFFELLLFNTQASFRRIEHCEECQYYGLGTNRIHCMT